jgi:DNA-binding transcriptional ArsR family regulator
MVTAAVEIDAVFRALADPTRRAVVERLGRGPAAVGELAAPFAMALPSFMQHLAVLEAAGVVRSRKTGRVRTVHLEAERLAPAETWLVDQRLLWSRRLDRLDAYLLSLRDTPPPPRPETPPSGKQP